MITFSHSMSHLTQGRLCVFQGNLNFMQLYRAVCVILINMACVLQFIKSADTAYIAQEILDYNSMLFCRSDLIDSIHTLYFVKIKTSF